MRTVYGVANCKGGQGKSTTVSTLARLCAHYGARVLVVDLAQPGTATSSLRDIWPDSEHGDLSSAMLSFQMLPPGRQPAGEVAAAALEAVALPVELDFAAQLVRRDGPGLAVGRTARRRRRSSPFRARA